MPNNTSYLKCSIDGVNGSGKSGTSARLAVGISKELYGGAPVLVADSEERWRFYKRIIFDVEKVPLIVVPGNTLIGIQKALQRAEAEQCCVFVGDQLTTPWMEAVKSFSFENGLLPFNRRQQLMNQWDPIIERFRYGQFHAICCGRLGWWWENLEDEEGNEQLHQGNPKFNAGGSANFGYEADLELAMRRHVRRKLLLGTVVEHICEVRKDAAGGVLNGQEFTWKTQKGPYKPGDYKPVFESFRPYLEFMAEVDAPVREHASTRDLLIAGKTAWGRDQDERKHLLEELDANLSFCFPTGEGKSKLAKMFRDLTLEALNGWISWSRMEDECDTDHIANNVFIVKAMRKRIEEKEIPTDHNSLIGLLKLSTDDVLRPGHGMTLVEMMTMGVKRGPQPAVAVMDRKAVDEQEIGAD